MIQRQHTDFLKDTLADACRAAKAGNVVTGRAYLAAGLGYVKRTVPAGEEKRQLIRLWEDVIARFTARFGPDTELSTVTVRGDEKGTGPVLPAGAGGAPAPSACHRPRSRSV